MKARLASRSLIGVTAAGMVALGLGTVSPAPAQAAEAKAPFPTQTLASLPALPSQAPVAGLEAGGGGVAGEPWTLIGLPGALGPDDPGTTVDESPVLQSNGVVVRFTSVPGRGPYRFTVYDPGKKESDPTALVWDSGVVSASNDLCTIVPDGANRQASCTVPATGKGFLNGYPGLRPGSTYRLVVVNGAGTDDQQTYAPRMFGVRVAPKWNGVEKLSVTSTAFNYGTGGFGLGLSYSTADLGVAPANASTTGLTPGLPQGWQLAGASAGQTRVTLVDAQGYQGQTKLLRVADPGGVTYLGCVPAGTGLTCSALDGLGASLSPTATVAGDGTVQLTDASSSTITTFDPSGRLTGLTRPQEPSVAIAYDSAGRVDTVTWSDVTWDVFYGGDKQCSDASLPPGFVPGGGNLCGWRATTQAGYSPGWMRILYTQPAGAQMARISRVMGLPADCGPDFGGCDVSQVDVQDYGWDDHNRPVAYRDAAHSLAALAGAVDPADANTLTSYAYDGLGRLVTVTQPANSSGDRPQQTMTYGPADPRLTPATRQLTTTVADTAGQMPPQSTIAAYDESGAPLYEVSILGEVSGNSVDAATGKGIGSFTGGLLTADGIDWSKASGATFTSGAYGRLVAKSQSRASNFDAAACLPDSPTRSQANCRANDPDGRSVVTSTTEYDQAAGVPEGLIASWFDSPTYSGNVAATSVVKQSDGSASPAGFALAPPAGTGDDGNWAVRMTGSVLFDQPVVYGIEVDVPDGFAESGVLMLDGSTICTPIAATRQSCTYDNTAANPNASTTSPHLLRIDVTHTDAQPVPAGSVIVRLTAGAGAPVVSGAPFRQRFSAPTTATGNDIYPDSAGGAKVALRQQSVYADPLSKSPSATTGLLAEGAAPLTIGSTTEADTMGAARPTSVIMPSGATRTQAYWGPDETPQSANLPFLDELPGYLQNLPQRSLPKSVTEPDGRTVTTVYDQIGRATCSIPTGGHWTCTLYDNLGRLAGSHVHGGGGQPDVVKEFAYTMDAASDLPMVATVTVNSLTPGGVLGDTRSARSTTTSRSTLAGDITEFADATGLVTTTTYDVLGRPTSTSMRQGADGAPFSTRTATYAPSGLLQSVARDGKTMVTIAYNQQRPWQVASYNYTMGAGVRAEPLDNPGSANLGSNTGTRWTLADGSTLDDTFTATLAGRLLSHTFGSHSYAYAYDGYGRLQKATVDGRDYTYGWDVDGLRTCAAEGTPNPSGVECSQLPGAYSYTYDKQRLMTTTDPLSAPGGDVSKQFSYDAEGNLTQVGPTALTYGASRQIASLTSPDSTTVYEYDAYARPRSEVTTRKDGSVSNVTYSYSASEGGPSIMTVDGRSMVLDTLPGGIVVVGASAGIVTSQGDLGQWLTPAGVPDPARPSQGYTPFGTSNEAAGRSADGGALPGWNSVSTTATGGFMNLGARTYLPRLAQFAQPDPFAGGSGAGPYSYVAGDPINSQDLSGTAAQSSLASTVFVGILGMLITGIGTWAISAGLGSLVESVSMQGAEFWVTGNGPTWAKLTAGIAGLVASTVATAAQMQITNNGQGGFVDYLTGSLSGAVFGGLNLLTSMVSAVQAWAPAKARQLARDAMQAVRAEADVVVPQVTGYVRELGNDAKEGIREVANTLFEEKAAPFISAKTTQLTEALSTGKALLNEVKEVAAAGGITVGAGSIAVVGAGMGGAAASGIGVVLGGAYYFREQLGIMAAIDVGSNLGTYATIGYYHFGIDTYVTRVRSWWSSPWLSMDLGEAVGPWWGGF